MPRRSDLWEPGDWVWVSSRRFDGCSWMLGMHPQRIAQAEKFHWAVIVNIRSQTYRGRKNKRKRDDGPVIEVVCPAAPVDKRCKFGCGARTRKAHTHYVRESDVEDYQRGVQTIQRIQDFLTTF